MSEETANSANSAENTDANLRTKRFSDTWRSKIRQDHNYAIEFAEGFFETAIEAEAEIDALRSRLAAAEAERDALRERIESWIDMTVNCAGVPQNPDSLPQMLLYEFRAVLGSNFSTKSLNVKDNLGGTR